MELEPYGFAGIGGERQGIFSDIVTAIGARSGLTHRNRVMPLKRMLKQLELGVSHCGIFLRQPWSEGRFDQVSLVMSDMRTILVAREGVTLEGIEDLKNHRLGWVNGSFPGTYIAQSPELDRFLTNSYRNSVDLLMLGRVDVIAGTELSLFYNLDQVGAREERLGTILEFNSEPVWLQCRTGRLPPEVLARLREAAEAVLADGTITRIIESYAIPTFTVREDRD